MAMYEVHQALTQSVIDLALGVNVAYENVDFDPAEGETFAVVTLIPDEAVSLGKIQTDVDETQGIYQISFYAPSGSNVADILQLVDQTLQFYYHNRAFVAGSQTVTIINGGRNAGRNTDGWFVIDCSITWKADIPRL